MEQNNLCKNPSGNEKKNIRYELKCWNIFGKNIASSESGLFWGS